MAKMLIDRPVVEQSLHVAMAAEHPVKLIAALRAALAEDAMQKFTDVNQELEAALAKPVQEPVIRYDGLYEYAHQHALDYNDLCRVVRAAITAPPQRKPVQEPVAWTDAERSEGRGRGGFINTPPTREHQRRVAQAWQELHAAIKAAEENT